MLCFTRDLIENCFVTARCVSVRADSLYIVTSISVIKKNYKFLLLRGSILCFSLHNPAD